MVLGSARSTGPLSCGLGRHVAAGRRPVRGRTGLLFGVGPPGRAPVGREQKSGCRAHQPLPVSLPDPHHQKMAENSRRTNIPVVASVGGRNREGATPTTSNADEAAGRPWPGRSAPYKGLFLNRRPPKGWLEGPGPYSPGEHRSS